MAHHGMSRDGMARDSRARDGEGRVGIGRVGVVRGGETVTDEVGLRLVVPGDDGLLLRATLRYDPADPFAVEATFGPADEAIVWVLGRDLLSDGLLAETGVGDVRVWPQEWHDSDPDIVLIELSSPDGCATLAVDAADLATFLRRTFAVVPRGVEAEFLDLDGVIARLLA